MQRSKESRSTLRQDTEDIRLGDGGSSVCKVTESFTLGIDIIIAVDETPNSSTNRNIPQLAAKIKNTDRYKPQIHTV
jgi:hypothetical protein